MLLKQKSDFGFEMKDGKLHLSVQIMCLSAGFCTFLRLAEIRCAANFTERIKIANLAL